MLSTKILKQRTKRGPLFHKTEGFFVAMNDVYKNSLEKFLAKRWLSFVILFLAVGVIALLYSNIPAEMAPLEDRSQITINAQTPEGATYEFTRDYIFNIAEMVMEEVPEIEGVIYMVFGSWANVRLFWCHLRKENVRSRKLPIIYRTG
jgi:multidrug efflux pump